MVIYFKMIWTAQQQKLEPEFCSCKERPTSHLPQNRNGTSHSSNSSGGGRTGCHHNDSNNHRLNDLPLPGNSPCWLTLLGPLNAGNALAAHSARTRTRMWARVGDGRCQENLQREKLTHDNNNDKSYSNINLEHSRNRKHHNSGIFVVLPTSG